MSRKGGGGGRVLEFTAAQAERQKLDNDYESEYNCDTNVLGPVYMEAITWLTESLALPGQTSALILYGTELLSTHMFNTL